MKVPHDINVNKAEVTRRDYSMVVSAAQTSSIQNSPDTSFSHHKYVPVQASNRVLSTVRGTSALTTGAKASDWSRGTLTETSPHRSIQNRRNEYTYISGLNEDEEQLTHGEIR